MINVLGPRPPEVWTPRRAVDRPRLRRRAVRQRRRPVRPRRAAGGLDLARTVRRPERQHRRPPTDDLEPAPQRLPGDLAALANAYRSGALNQANNLDQVAIINLGGPDRASPTTTATPGSCGLASSASRAISATTSCGSASSRSSATSTSPPRPCFAMDRWLAVVEADHRKIPLSPKIIENRPADIRNQCEAALGLPLPSTVCDLPLAQTRFGTPRTVAGDSIASTSAPAR